MFGLGLKLTLKSGREAVVRLVVTTLAAAIGVAILLGVLADYHAYEKASNRPSWESTSAASGSVVALIANFGTTVRTYIRVSLLSS